MQKLVQFYHQKQTDMLKLGCTPPNLANICLHKSTNEKFYPFCESDRDSCEKIGEETTGGPAVVFTRKAFVDEIIIRDSSKICKSTVGIDASQLYPYSICQETSRGLYTRWEFDSEMQKLTVSMKMYIEITAKQCMKLWMLLSLCPCQETRSSWIDEDIERGNKRRLLSDLICVYAREKRYKIEEMWECLLWQYHIQSNFSYKRLFFFEIFLEKERD